jgi:methionyl-tRNA formyltransferase
MTPWPGAFCDYLGPTGQSTMPITLLGVEAAGDVNAAPGAVVESGRDAGLVATGQGGLRVLKVKPAGKRAMSWGDFKNGYGAAAGDLFA